MRIIFVCTSNVCRSPPAAALAQRWLNTNRRDEDGEGKTANEVISRSLTTAYEPENSPASEYSIQIMKETYGINISSHRSRLLSEEDVRHADVIVGITASHREHIIRSFPEGRVVGFPSCHLPPVHIFCIFSARKDNLHAEECSRPVARTLR
jgi:protein-tyrosine-phosphatase